MVSRINFLVFWMGAVLIVFFFLSKQFTGDMPSVSVICIYHSFPFLEVVPPLVNRRFLRMSI